MNAHPAIGRGTAAVAVVAWLGFAAAAFAKPSFASVAGDWALDGEVRVVFGVGGFNASQRGPLPVSLAHFDKQGNGFAMIWVYDTDPPPPEVRIEGDYKQKNKKVTATRIQSDYLKALIAERLAEAGMPGADLDPGPSKLNLTVVNSDTLKGEVQIQYRVTAGEARGNVIVKLKLVGAFVPGSAR